MSPMNPKCVDELSFRSACGRFPTGVTVTTLTDNCGKPFGITVSSFTSVSLAPPLVLVCIDHRSPIVEHLQAGKHFGINVLSDHHQDLSVHFSRNWTRRFTGIPWYSGRTG